MLFAPTLSPNHRLVTRAEDLDGVVRACAEGRTVAFDFETSGLRWWDNQVPVGVALATWLDGEPAPRAWYIPVGHLTVEAQCPIGPAKRAFADVMRAAPDVVAHNAKFDLCAGRAGGWAVPGSTVRLHDTMIQAFLIREGRRYKLEALAEEVLGDSTAYGDAWEAAKRLDGWLAQRAKILRLTVSDYLDRFGHAEVPIALEGEYSCRDAAHTLYLHAAQYDEARGVGQPWHDRRQVLYDNEMDLVRALAAMEWTGQRLDTDHLRRLGQQLERDQAVLAQTLASALSVPESFRWGNDHDVRDLLFSRMKLPVSRSSAKTGDASVDRAALLPLIPKCPAIESLLEWREADKVRTTYTDNLAAKVDKNGRIHASFLQHGTDTGRLSSRAPNLQNIPARHPTLGKAVRAAFVIDAGSARVFCDYSQIELRMLAWITGCRSLTEGYETESYLRLLSGEIDDAEYRRRRQSDTGSDVHAIVAQSVFGADPGSAEFKRARSAAKIINFGVPYGAGWRLLAENPQLRLSEREAKSLFTAYHERNPEIQSTREDLFRSMLRDPQTRFVNWAGRARHAPKLRHPAEDLRATAERAAFASLVQGSAAELTRFSLVRLWQAQESGELPAVTTSTVHDEVQVDCDERDAAFVAGFVQRTMEDFTGLFGTIPILADVEWSKSNWANKEAFHVR